MSTLMDVARAKGRQDVASSLRAGSIREVSLVGGPPGRWSAGDRVSWDGRSYQVVREEPGYAHLRPVTG